MIPKRGLVSRVFLAQVLPCVRAMSHKLAGDVGGGAAVTTPKKAKASGGKKRGDGDSAVAGGSRGSPSVVLAVEEGNATCFLCQQGENEAPVDQTHDSKLFHKDCRNAIRAHGRTMAKQPKLRDYNKGLLKSDPDAWRQVVMPFIDATSQSRNAAREESKARHQKVAARPRCIAHVCVHVAMYAGAWTYFDRSCWLWLLDWPRPSLRP